MDHTLMPQEYQLGTTLSKAMPKIFQRRKWPLQRSPQEVVVPVLFL
jgi:hypothetical protein